MKRFKRILATMLALVCVLAVFPTMEAEAGIVTVNGGCTTRATAYNWGAYSTTNSITVVLPENEDDFWVKFTLPRDKAGLCKMFL